MTECHSSPLLTVLIPAYGEIQNLRILLPKLTELRQRSLGSLSRILVVLPADCEQEEWEEVLSLGGVPVRRGPSNSFGDAIRSGIQNLTSDGWVVIMDADGSHNPDRIPDMLNGIGNAHVCIASRYVSHGSSDNPWHLRLMSVILNRTFALVAGLQVKDMSNNFRLYRSSDLTRISLQGQNFEIVEEILIKISRSHGRSFHAIEIADHFSERQFGETKRKLGLFIVSYIWFLISMRFDRQSYDRT